MNTPNYLLQLETDEARALGYAIVDRLLAYQEHLSEMPVVRVKTEEELRAELWETLPVQAKAPLSVLDRVEKEIFSSTNHETHPRFFAFIPAPSNFVGALAELLRTGYNIFFRKLAGGLRTGDRRTGDAGLDPAAGWLPGNGEWNILERRIAGEPFGRGHRAGCATAARSVHAWGGVRI